MKAPALVVVTVVAAATAVPALVVVVKARPFVCLASRSDVLFIPKFVSGCIDHLLFALLEVDSTRRLACLRQRVRPLLCRACNQNAVCLRSPSRNHSHLQARRRYLHAFEITLAKALHKFVTLVHIYLALRISTTAAVAASAAAAIGTTSAIATNTFACRIVVLLVRVLHDLMHDLLIVILLILLQWGMH